MVCEESNTGINFINYVRILRLQLLLDFSDCAERKRDYLEKRWNRRKLTQTTTDNDRWRRNLQDAGV